ncbi:MAG: carboxypeptidase M32 [Chitinophagales bacterium]|nr:carboxypeptidase M32 [Bacteroidota bacterium]MCB9042831.1 carboxypeptidase M32 [Chitinophagales bacterium]
MNTNYQKYTEKLVKITDVNKAIAILGWDQEINMPEGGAAIRAQQIATLSGIAHELFTDHSMGDLLNELTNDPSLTPEQANNVAHSKQEFDKKTHLPASFVQKLSHSTSEGFQAWLAARKKNDFAVFAPFLEKMVNLKRQQANLLGFEKQPYNALLDEFEPNLQVAQLEVLFADVRQKISGLLAKIAAKPVPKNDFMFRFYAHQKQWDFGISLLKQIGYDFTYGRQDISTHPFTTDLGMQDVRVTTRINEHNFHEMTWSTLHEGGHGLYEQGLLPQNYGLPSGAYLSLSMHEAQSRLYENNVGRSKAFWQYNFPILQKIFPDNLQKISAEQFYAAANIVQPGFIRTSADEISYHFHIMIRYEIEKALIEGNLAVKDVPDIWNSLYKKYLNLTVKNDLEGCLQDVHWSHGLFGYFPTYSLGSFYAAQIFRAAEKAMPQLATEIQQGSLLGLNKWLRENIYQYGKKYSIDELCKKITGEELNLSAFIDYAEKKYTDLYNL